MSATPTRVLPPASAWQPGPSNLEIKADVEAQPDGRRLVGMEATWWTRRRRYTAGPRPLPATQSSRRSRSCPPRSALADCRTNLGWLLFNTGRNDEALSVYRLARADQEALAAAPGALAEPRRDLANTVNRVALVLARTGKSSEAEAEYRKALAIGQKLADDNPAVTVFRSLLASSHHNLGFLLSSTGEPSTAEAEYRKALAIQQRLADDNPAVTVFRGHLSRSHNSLGRLLSDTGKSSEAAAEFRMALALRQKLADDNPAIPHSSAGTGEYLRGQLAPAGRKNARGDRLLHAGRGNSTDPHQGQLGNPRR